MKWRASLAALLLAGCAGGGRIVPAPPYAPYEATGIASWYGEAFAGRPTASGERFDPDALTAAHRTLPLGTWVEVTAMATGRAIVLRVNDRGPGRRDRLIDLSHGAARLLRIERMPATVRVRSLRPGERQRPGLVRPGRQGLQDPRDVMPPADYAQATSLLPSTDQP